jgi:hypothetical protein
LKQQLSNQSTSHYTGTGDMGVLELKIEIGPFYAQQNSSIGPTLYAAMVWKNLSQTQNFGRLNKG